MIPGVLSASLLLAAPCSPSAPLGISQVRARRADFDAAAARFVALRRRGAAVRKPMPYAPEAPLVLALPPEVAPLGSPDASELGTLPDRVRDALTRRLEHERRRGFHQWASLNLPPRRVAVYDPPGADGQPAWTRNIYLDWDRDRGPPRGLPELSELLAAAAVPAPPTPPPGDDPDWERLAAELEDAVDTAERYRPRFEPRRVGTVWENAGYWRRLALRARRSAEAFADALALARARRRSELAAHLRARLPVPTAPPRGASDEQRARWDRVFDNRVLGALPAAMRLGVERWIAMAYLRGGWEAKRSRLDWWRRGGEVVERRERTRLREARSTFDLTRAYRYELSGG